MKIEAKLFLFLSVFFFVMSTIYGFWAGSQEPVGTVGFALTGGLSLIVGSVLWFSSRRLHSIRPEDNTHAEVSDVVEKDNATMIVTIEGLGQICSYHNLRPSRFVDDGSPKSIVVISHIGKLLSHGATDKARASLNNSASRFTASV